MPSGVTYSPKPMGNRAPIFGQVVTFSTCSVSHMSIRIVLLWSSHMACDFRVGDISARARSAWIVLRRDASDNCCAAVRHFSNGSRAGMTSTRSTRLLAPRKLPKLLRCQDFPPSALTAPPCADP
jgi:hypothetical protein